MPEGDTIHRVADVMRRTLADDELLAARGRPGGAQVERLVGARVAEVRTRGKHLLMEFDHGLTLHTHLGMSGAWHRYRPGEAWRASAADAVVVLETQRAVAVCFEAPTVELLETRAVPIHPGLSALGPDLLDPGFDVGAATERLLAFPGPVAVALLDQHVVSGIGNVYRSEVLFIAQRDPFQTAGSLAPLTARGLLELARDLLRANIGGGERVTMPDASGARPDASPAGSRERGRWVYGRTGQPCRRCGTRIRCQSIGRLPRRLYWCPRCESSAGLRTERASAR